MNAQKIAPRVLPLLALLLPATLRATCGNCSGAELPAFLCPIAETIQTGPSCSGFKNCQTPVIAGTRIDVVPTGSGTSEARLVVDVKASWNTQAFSTDFKLKLFWSTGATPTHPTTSLCQHTSTDRAETYLRFDGLTCAGAPYSLGTYSLQAVVCDGAGSCEKATDVPDLQILVTKQMLGCPEPPKSSCCGDGGCKLCLRAGQGGASPAGEGACADPPGSGPGARLRYRAGGVGGPGWPGTAAWNTVLGRYWSHDYAERIVQDPGVSHVWLMTRFATFREFTDGNADGTYETASPSDEKRRLTKVAAGWELRGLDGAVQSFDNAGLWTRTTDKNGNAKVAEYTGGVLTRVTFPDGRSEQFTYLGGKLRTIREVGVDGTTGRTWTYTWNGLDLERIDRPDNTAWRFVYSSDPALVGYLVRIDLLASSGGLSRVETAWEHDASGNATKIWRGDPSSNGPNAVDLWSLSYTNPQLPTSTQVTDPLGKTATYQIGRDPGSRKPRLARLEGNCPACGAGPNAIFEYNDSVNPLLPTAMTDGRGLRTTYTYNADGQITQKTEAASTPLARDTHWQYHATYKSFPTRMDAPSTSGGAALRETVLGYDAAGNLLTRTIQGAESGSAFNLTTTTAYNAAGQPLSIDPPGFGTADVTTYTYDPARGSLVPLTRTDPLVGATSFGHDAFNRRTSVTDPNLVDTLTTYDLLDRVTSVTQKGDVSSPDLVTTYTYNGFGDLFQTTLPEGNVIEYGYDAAGRLISIERKPDATTAGERTFYTLDKAGNRTREELRRWTGSAWTAESWTDFVYSSRCRLDKVIRPNGTPTGAVTEYSYDCEGNLARVWDANHPSNSQTSPATQVYGYDELDRLSSLTQPWTGAGGGNTVTTYGYDSQDHLTQVTDAEGNTTAYTYSDRDLMTRQISPVSGITTWAYNEHGEQVSEIDARNVVVTRTPDVLDRVTAVSYPDTSLNTIYTYDTGTFGKGRLAGISRQGQTIAYTYDRFGRMLQDGALSYTWDENGNRKTIGYPDSIVATYTYDYADREQSLNVQVGANPSLQIVNNATYKPFGPLATLPLGNGLTETHSYDARYSPTGIQVTGTTPRLNWSYSTDAVGNITGITDLLNASQNRTYGYQDINYFLTLGNGPWGTRSWTYDKIGNRLSEIRGAITDTYTYLPNTTGGHNPKLLSIAQGAVGAGTRTVSYDAAGNEMIVADNQQQLSLIHDGAGRLSTLDSLPAGARATMAYDGRGYLQRAQGDPTECSPGSTLATYSSDGLLHQRVHRSLFDATAPNQESASIFYFAGRPVAVLKLFSSSSSLTFLSTDHLGTPVLATSDTGSLAWQGGFEPFGADWSGAGAAGMFLRFPGQWEDEVWNSSELPNDLYQNLHRWYESGIGKYLQPDLIGLRGGIHLFLYAFGNPISFRDRWGLQATDQECCERAFHADLFRDESGNNAGGIVVCCEGRRVACADPTTGNPMVDLPGELLLADCAVEHEKDHFDDVPCPKDCTLKRPNFKLFVFQGKAECSASKVEVECLKRSQSKCGGNQACLQRLSKRIGKIRQYGNSFRKCPGL